MMNGRADTGMGMTDDHPGLALDIPCCLRSLRSMISRSSLMAGNLHVRNLEDDLIARLKRRAARHGRSTEAEHREILRQALGAEDVSSFDKLAADLRKLTKRRKQTPSEMLLRDGRRER